MLANPGGSEVPLSVLLQVSIQAGTSQGESVVLAVCLFAQALLLNPRVVAGILSRPSLASRPFTLAFMCKQALQLYPHVPFQARLIRQWFKQFKPMLWGDALGSILHARQVLQREALEMHLQQQQQVGRAVAAAAGGSGGSSRKPSSASLQTVSALIG